MSARLYHMMPKQAWEALSPAQNYQPDSLATEGFIHCTGSLDLLAEVGNRFYRSHVGNFVLLIIEAQRVQAEIRWEAADGHLFPHIYGPLNVDAVVDVVDFPRTCDGEFLPATIA